MESLNLSGSSRKSDGWQEPALARGRKCLGRRLSRPAGLLDLPLIAIISSIFIAVAGNNFQPAAQSRILILAGSTFFVLFVGGMGVRQASWPAAAFIFAIYRTGNTRRRRMSRR